MIKFMKAYFKLIPPKNATSIVIHIDSILESNNELVDITEKNDTTVDVTALSDFKSILKGGGGKPRRTFIIIILAI